MPRTNSITPQIRRPAFQLALILALGMFSVVPPIWAQQHRGIKPEKAAQTEFENGRYYALIIGVDDYKPPMKKLKTAVNDAKAVGDLLAARYGFEVQSLIDQQATRFNILEAIGKYRYTLREQDNLLIYYAGHGYSDRDADKAYWLPVDAESEISANRIIADDLTTDVKVLPSRHVLIISDSCYSGGLSRGSGEPDSGQDQPTYIARMMRLRSRTLLASGGDEPVADSGSNGHSVFAFALLQALSETDKPAFSAIDLFYSAIRQQVAGRSEQVPEYSTIRNSGSDGGDFVFVRKFSASAVERLNTTAPMTASLVYFKADLTTIEQGQSVNLSWRTNNASMVTINGIAVDSSGTKSFSPDTTWTYQLSANDGAFRLGSVTVAVLPKAQAAILPPAPNSTDADMGNLSADLAEARADNSNGKFNDAEALMLKDTGLRPDSDSLWYELGQAQMGLKKWIVANASMARAIVLSTASKKPNLELIGGAYAALGEIDAHSNKPTEAFRHLFLAEKNDPAKAGIYLSNLAAVFSNNGANADGEVTAAEQAISADPDNPLPYFLKGSVLATRSTWNDKTGAVDLPPGCIEAYRKYLELAPDGPHAFVAKAILRSP